jgi:NADH-quinone oxidoreductase subunit H
VVLPILGILLFGLAILMVRPGVVDFVQGPAWFILKIVIILFVYVWVRWTLPRFRYDQLMSIGWKFLLPVALANIVLTSLAVVMHK